MKRIFILLIPIFASFILPAQNSLQHKTDSVSRLVLKEFNNKDVTALYALTGESFKKALPFETFLSTGFSIRRNSSYPENDV